ncbi:MAG: FRG domain-containing protein [Oscillospiraceae bacterium]|nr:FRG domain-containing protein [Oscillospiraceae bacterium]
MLVSEFKIKTFEEFLMRMYTLLGGWPSSNAVVFRGQAKDWPLVSSIYRANNYELIKKYSHFQCDFDSSLAYRVAEENLILEFYNMANLSKLKVPKIPRFLSRNNASFNTLNFVEKLEKWPLDDSIELMALAQHYGVPTSFIDWTYDFNVALYFAVFGAIKEANNNGKYISDEIVIWTLPLYKLDLINSNSFGNKIPLNFVTPSYYDNENLGAQKGILAYWEETLCHNEKVNDTPLDKKIETYIYSNYSDLDCIIKTANEFMIKFLIPTSECKKIAKYLYNNNYNAAFLFPGYDGVVKSIEEQRMLEKFIIG